MPILDSNNWSGTDPRMQQMQGMGGMGMQGVPQLPPTLAAQLAQRAQMRMNPQMNPLMAMGRPPQQMGNEMMPPFQPTGMPKPKEFWEQQFQPTDTMRSMSVQDAMPKDAGIATPGQLPQVGGPQIPNNTQGMGLGATAPQMIMGSNAWNDMQTNMMKGQAAFPNGYPKMDWSSIRPPQNSAVEADQQNRINDLKKNMFGAYMNLFPEGNL